MGYYGYFFSSCVKFSSSKQEGIFTFIAIVTIHIYIYIAHDVDWRLIGDVDYAVLLFFFLSREIVDNTSNLLYPIDTHKNMYLID